MDFYDPNIEEYCIANSHQPSPLCEELARYTRANVEMAGMLIGPMEASLLAFLIRATGARRVLEFGTFTGYSALAMAEALPPDGQLVTCDINLETTKIAQSFWDRSEHGKKIKALSGPAHESITKLTGLFDFVFVDADKKGYKGYVDFSLAHLSKSGMIVLDNMLYGGDVLRADAGSSATALRDLSESIVRRDDLFVTLLPIRDGVLLLRKR